MFSIIVPMYNAERTIRLCLDAIVINKGIEIILVDDGSTDTTTAIVSEYMRLSPNIKLLHTNHSGPSAARNHGARHAKGDILVFLDSDCIPGKGWIAAIKKGFKNPGVVAVASQYSGAHTKDFISLFAFYELLFRERGFSKYVKSAPSCNLAVKRDIFFASSMFPEGIIAGEDIVLSAQVAKHGKILWEKGNGVTHCFRTTIRGYLKQQFSYSRHTIRKFLGSPNLLVAETIHDKNNYFEIILTGAFPFAIILATIFPPLWWSALGILFLILMLNLPFMLFLMKKENILFAKKGLLVVLLRNLAWPSGALRGLI